MKYLIVNADDFGLTAGVNRAIIDGHRNGLITSTTVMVNMPAFDEAVRLARETPSLGIGLHFNITQGGPVTEPSKLKSLLDGRGKFPGTSVELLKRSVAGRLKTDEVKLELRAQIEKAQKAGLRLTHIDSHKHSHAIPQVGEAIVSTIKDYAIEAVRSPQERWAFAGFRGPLKFQMQSISALLLSQLCRVSSSRYKRAGIKTPDAFFGVSQTGFWTIEWLKSLARRLPDGVSELMCHPGYQDEQLKNSETRLLESRFMELRMLTDPDVIEAMRDNGVELINYNYLRGENAKHAK